ncbi:outer membrane beta-barrel domain-containing protein [Endozoicomonas sp. G2_1]|uniref:outer membrane beta-barrel domain-containing protein n=1 Tax=Endozoicomonas sp. G2_1 TaxID=2821091 RepID=UPI001AD9C224|nr:outer membrane beta-barrel domain-containing protein [Endozoicomonas sp. G2_1]MBO9488849.1 outer membrane beta-barrel domain-containing protein [Endozoicomonas sp. G2_1]
MNKQISNQKQLASVTKVWVRALTALLAFALTNTVYGQTETNSEQPLEAATEPQVKPQVERRQVLEDLLDSENFEFGVKVGLISIEDFESSTWYAGHFAYHISEDFYLKAEYGQATAGTSSFERLANTAPLLTEDQRDLTYYGLNLGYNVLPGEVFLGDDLAFNSVFSVELGGGTTEFAGEDQFTINFSTNFRIFMNDWIAWDIGVTDYVFDNQITGENKTTHNLNFTTGVSFYF